MPGMLRASAALTALGLLSGCTTTDVTVAAPTPPAAAADACSALLTHLEHGVAGRSRRPVQPVSPYTAAWGDPPVTLRCGVPTKAPDASATEADIGGVTWRVRRAGDVVQWDAEGRAVGVEVRIPVADNAQENVIADIGVAITATVPAVAEPAGSPTQEGTQHTG
ncbi:MAG: putative lipoprotein [Frankiales bacterium]|nr:putative lipoprotein [Frankiales bacterium]